MKFLILNVREKRNFGLKTENVIKNTYIASLVSSIYFIILSKYYFFIRDTCSYLEIKRFIRCIDETYKSVLN